LLLRILHRRGNQTYVVLAKGSKVMYGFLCFWTVHVNRQKQRGPFRALNLKTIFSDFCGQSLIYELILALVALWLLVNWSKKTSKEKCPIDFFFILFKYILTILLLFFFLWFNRGYNVNNRLDFILTVIKGDYNTNDRLKFILSFIRWENGINDRLKLVKNEWKETKIERNKDESQKNKKWIKSLGFGNLLVEERRTDEEQWRTEENLHGFAYGNLSEALRKHLGLDFHHGNNFFHPKQLKCIARGIRDP